MEGAGEAPQGARGFGLAGARWGSPLMWVFGEKTPQGATIGGLGGEGRNTLPLFLVDTGLKGL